MRGSTLEESLTVPIANLPQHSYGVAETTIKWI
jgi:hypothetical protein